ncbi:MAG: M1 family aminopeptidase [Saprospiraceae bacterium]
MMWYEIFKFELQYRAKRTETYLFFAALFLFSLVAFNFVFEGQNIGLVKENAPFIIARIMAVVAGIFMVITSMIMGVPILRDFEYQMESLLFVNPIKKRDYLLGRFLGSFAVLVFVFSGLLWGIILGEYMPWRDADNLLPFNFWAYLKPFLTLVLPTLFFGGSLFFVSGALSRKLMVVYTQGILFFVVFILSRNIENPMIAAILEPFSYMALGEVVKSWSIVERNTLSIPIERILLYNRFFWLLVGVLALVIGYYAFNFNVIKDKPLKNRLKPQKEAHETPPLAIKIPDVTLSEGFKAKSIQLKVNALFYFKSILREVSFWAIVLCGVVIIFINSISLGTSYGVDSYPATYLIVEELQETAIPFFLIILVFYSGELIWKERGAKLNGIYDALPVTDFIHLAGKFIGLLLTYMVLLVALILSGIVFQTLNGYYHYEWGVYLTGFFLEVLPFLVLFTFLSFFLQVMANSKFIGHLLVLTFFLITMALEVLDYGHPLFKFGGISLGIYSDMNGYGHFLPPYLWFEMYWLAFSVFLFVITVVFTIRGAETSLKNRWKLGKQRLSKPLVKLGATALLAFVLMGSYIFYNTNILNDYWSNSQKLAFRADYEKTLKKFEQIAQPKIIGINLKVELYPANRDYTVEGYYMLANMEKEPIHKVYVQKLLDPRTALAYVDFEGGATLDDTFKQYDYYAYALNQALQPGDTIKMTFKQTYTTKGFVGNSSDTKIVYNGTFFGSYHFPTLGYNRKYELKDDIDRAKYGLAPSINLAKRNDQKEASNERLGGDYNGISFEIIIGTDMSQMAIAPGPLQQEWQAGNRRYFHYKMDKDMVNFYDIVSARYEVLRDTWAPAMDSLEEPVALEIYYHKGHEYNLQRMMEAMKMSFDYFSTYFSPYQYKQMRIMEFPRYASFAQSFPNTVPFSEAMGFMLNIKEEKDVDMAFYVTAHELAHQWWGLQVAAADVQGRYMILESLAQYSALMVLKQRYPEAKIQQFLQMEQDAYWKGSVAETKQELPLALVEGQEYIYYRKGSLNLYAFQDYISEEKVNLALSRFIKDWCSFDCVAQNDRYATTADLLDYFREVTPDSLQYVITDLFETITYYDTETIEGEYERLGANQYQLNLTVAAKKYRVDSLGVATAITMNDWVDVGVYATGKDGKEELIYLKKHKITDQKTKIEILVNQQPSKAGIDPLNKLIDRTSSNNLKTLQLKET